MRRVHGCLPLLADWVARIVQITRVLKHPAILATIFPVSMQADHALLAEDACGTWHASQPTMASPPTTLPLHIASTGTTPAGMAGGVRGRPRAGVDPGAASTSGTTSGSTYCIGGAGIGGIAGTGQGMGGSQGPPLGAFVGYGTSPPGRSVGPAPYPGQQQLQLAATNGSAVCGLAQQLQAARALQLHLESFADLVSPHIMHMCMCENRKHACFCLQASAQQCACMR